MEIYQKCLIIIGSVIVALVALLLILFGLCKMGIVKEEWKDKLLSCFGLGKEARNKRIDNLLEEMQENLREMHENNREIKTDINKILRMIEQMPGFDIKNKEVKNGNK